MSGSNTHQFELLLHCHEWVRLKNFKYCVFPKKTFLECPFPVIVDRSQRVLAKFKRSLLCYSYSSNSAGFCVHYHVAHCIAFVQYPSSKLLTSNIHFSSISCRCDLTWCKSDAKVNNGLRMFSWQEPAWNSGVRWGRKLPGMKTVAGDLFAMRIHLWSILIEVH